MNNFLDVVRRKHLQTLQPSAINCNLLVGSRSSRICQVTKQKRKLDSLEDGENAKQQKKSASKRKTFCEAGVQTLGQGDADLVLADEPPLEYWKILAEERRVALEKALLENESLHDQLEVLEVENAELKKLSQDSEKLLGELRFLIDDDG